MTELAEKLDELDLAQYLERFLEQGFDTWDTILDIKETDLYVLGQLWLYAFGLDFNAPQRFFGRQLGPLRLRQIPLHLKNLIDFSFKETPEKNRNSTRS